MSRRKKGIFTQFTTIVSALLGRPWMFVVALGILGAWGISGPILGFSDTWQLIINTGTTIVTFLMVFIIQNTQNRDNMAMNIKLDAIMDKLNITDRELVEAEDRSDKKLEREQKDMQRKAAKKNRAKKN